MERGGCFRLVLSKFQVFFESVKKNKNKSKFKEKKENFETYYYKMASFSNVEFRTGTGLQQWLPCTS